MATVGLAPCQCFSPGANQTTSPGRISSTGPPHFCALPTPEMTISVCPSGWVCHAVLAPGSKVTLAPRTRAGSGASNRGSTRTVPVKYPSGPLLDGREPHRSISMTDLQNSCRNAAPHPLLPDSPKHPAVLRAIPITAERRIHTLRLTLLYLRTRLTPRLLRDSMCAMLPRLHPAPFTVA